MTTLTIQVSEKNRDLFDKLAKRLNIKILQVVEEDREPNSVTKKAIADARSGKTKKIEDIGLFFKNL